MLAVQTIQYTDLCMTSHATCPDNPIYRYMTSHAIWDVSGRVHTGCQVDDQLTIFLYS